MVCTSYVCTQYGVQDIQSLPLGATTHRTAGFQHLQSILRTTLRQIFFLFFVPFLFLDRTANLGTRDIRGIARQATRFCLAVIAWSCKWNCSEERRQALCLSLCCVTYTYMQTEYRTLRTSAGAAHQMPQSVDVFRAGCFCHGNQRVVLAVFAMDASSGREEDKTPRFHPSNQDIWRARDLRKSTSLYRGANIDDTVTQTTLFDDRDLAALTKLQRSTTLVHGFRRGVRLGEHSRPLFLFKVCPTIAILGSFLLYFRGTSFSLSAP